MREEFIDPRIDPRIDSELLRPKVEDVVEESEESGLRPKSLSEFVGQRELKEKLTIVLEAARRRSEAVDHLLFAGPPGLGKTTLSGIIAEEMRVMFYLPQTMFRTMSYRSRAAVIIREAAA